MIDRRGFLLGATGVLAGTALMPSLRAEAAGPPKSGRVLFGYPPGALGSLIGRGLTKILADEEGMTYAFSNVEGRNTRLASEQAMVAVPDGATLLQAQSTSMTLLPNVYKHLGYDPIRDFAPLAVFGDFTFSLTVGPMVPRSVSNLRDYVAWVKATPDARDVGFSIYGSQGHLSVLMLSQMLDVAIRPLPYKGTAMMIEDLSDGHIAAGFTAAGNGNADLWTNGTLRSIGVTRGKRLPYWPSIPTLQEQGVEGMDIGGWYGWFAPSRTPSDVVSQWRETLGRIQRSPAYRTLNEQLLITDLNVAPDQISHFMQQDTEHYRRLVSVLGLAMLD